MKSLLLGSALAVACALASTALHAEPVIIVNADNHASADASSLKKIFLGKERSLDGVHTVETVDVEEGNPIRAAFLEKFLGKSESELRQYWARLVFTGKATPPRVVGDDAAVRAWVAHNKDAIGCIDAARVDHSVRVLSKIQ